ncbi:MAG: hypothetical protein GF329_08130 [Candidatus Lokiarchaeota archaeon]|nr:hypothetical protein [Candidatus Lokiarchaeota archaeon]
MSCKKFSLFFLAILQISLNIILFAQKSEFHEMVGTKDDEKNLEILWNLPEKKCWKDFLRNNVLKDYEKLGYKYSDDTPVFLSDYPKNDEGIIITKDRKGDIESFLYILNSIESGYEVFGLFTHGHHVGSKEGHLCIEYCNSEAEVRKIIWKIENKNMFKGYVTYGTTPSGDDFHYAVMLKASYLNDRFSAKFMNNGIVFLMACSSAVFAKSFVDKGAAVVYCFKEPISCLNISNSFVNLSKLLQGINQPGHFHSTKEAYKSLYDTNLAMETKSQEDLVLKRNARIDELMIYKGDYPYNVEDKYYHYKYKDAGKFNPKTPYPYPSYDKKKVLTYDQSKRTYKYLLKPALIDKELRIFIKFSDEIATSSSDEGKLPKVTIGPQRKRTRDDLIIDMKKTDHGWFGSFLIDKKKSVLFKKNMAYIYVDAMDKFYDGMPHLSALDKSGDGNWKLQDDEANDNNHWFEVESPVEIKAMFLEGDNKGAENYTVSYLVNGSNDRRMIGYAPSAERFNYVRAAGMSQAARETHLMIELKITGVTEKKKA